MSAGLPANPASDVELSQLVTLVHQAYNLHLVLAVDARLLLDWCCS